MIHRESRSRKNDVALVAVVSKQKSFTSNSGPTEELHLRSQQLLVVAHLFRGLQDNTKQLQLRGRGNHLKNIYDDDEWAQKKYVIVDI